MLYCIIDLRVSSYEKDQGAMISVRDTREGVWVILLGLSLYVEYSLHISISLILVL